MRWRLGPLGLRGRLAVLGEVTDDAHLATSAARSRFERTPAEHGSGARVGKWYRTALNSAKRLCACSWVGIGEGVVGDAPELHVASARRIDGDPDVVAASRPPRQETDEGITNSASRPLMLVTM